MVFLVQLGCGGGSGIDDSDASTGDGSVDASVPPDAGSTSVFDIDPTPDPSCTGTWIVGITGQMVDIDGDPIAGVRTQLCLRVSGTNQLVCLSPPQSDAEGNFEIPIVSENHRCLAEGALRLVLPGTNNATTYCELELAPTDGVVITEEPFILFSTTPATDLPDLGDETMAREVEFDDGLVVEVTPDDISFDGDYEALGSNYLPANQLAGTCIVADAPEFVGAYAFSPEADVTSAGFPIDLSNPSGLPANSTVELYVLGGLNTTVGTDPEVVPEADWVLGGTATVSSDGARITGGMLHAFTWLGIHPVE